MVSLTGTEVDATDIGVSPTGVLPIPMGATVDGLLRLMWQSAVLVAIVEFAIMLIQALARVIRGGDNIPRMLLPFRMQFTSLKLAVPLFASVGSLAARAAIAERATTTDRAYLIGGGAAMLGASMAFVATVFGTIRLAQRRGASCTVARQGDGRSSGLMRAMIGVRGRLMIWVGPMVPGVGNIFENHIRGREYTSARVLLLSAVQGVVAGMFTPSSPAVATICVGGLKLSQIGYVAYSAPYIETVKVRTIHTW